MTFTSLIIFGMATWRIAFMLVNEDGPWKIFRSLRERVGIAYQDGQPVAMTDSVISGILSCVWCCSVWVGFGWFAFSEISPLLALKIATAFSFSTAALVIDHFLNSR